MVVLSFTLGPLLAGGADVVGQVSGRKRRSHFGLRVVLSILAIPAVLLVLVWGAALHVVPQQTSIVAFVLMLFCSPALAFGPSVLYRVPDSAPDDTDPGGGSSPNQPSSPPDRPDGDLPLPDAEPGRWRVRDHRPDLLRGRPRRSAPEPDRRPVSPSPGKQHLRP